MKHVLDQFEGGYTACRNCGGANKSLTTDCPNVTMSPEQLDAVIAGRVDYKNGRWVNPKYETYGEGT